MTLREAMRDGIKRVRKPYWNATASLELPEVNEQGRHGPWCTLRDLGTESTLLITECGQDETDWEASPTQPPA